MYLIVYGDFIVNCSMVLQYVDYRYYVYRFFFLIVLDNFNIEIVNNLKKWGCCYVICGGVGYKQKLLVQCNIVIKIYDINREMIEQWNIEE